MSPYSALSSRTCWASASSLGADTKNHMLMVHEDERAHERRTEDYYNEWTGHHHSRGQPAGSWKEGEHQHGALACARLLRLPCLPTSTGAPVPATDGTREPMWNALLAAAPRSSDPTEYRSEGAPWVAPAVGRVEWLRPRGSKGVRPRAFVLQQAVGVRMKATNYQ